MMLMWTDSRLYFSSFVSFYAKPPFYLLCRKETVRQFVVCHRWCTALHHRFVDRVGREGTSNVLVCHTAEHCVLSFSVYLLLFAILCGELASFSDAGKLQFASNYCFFHFSMSTKRTSDSQRDKDGGREVCDACHRVAPILSSFT